MKYYRENVVKIMQSWVGLKESDKSYVKILNIYNTITPIPRGHKMNTSDAWCAATVSAAFHSAGYDELFPLECSCSKIIAGAQKMGIWMENDAYVPKAGDCVIYNWDDNGSGDCKTGSHHIGMVEKVSGNSITVIEGNYGNAVKRRTIKVNQRYIRGFVIPKFDQVIPPKTLEVRYKSHDDVVNTWLPAVTGHSTSDSQNGYCGILGHAMDGLMIQIIGEPDDQITYCVHTVGGGWLGEIHNYDEKDAKYGYAGVFNKPIDGIMVKSNTGKTVCYRSHLKGGKWLGEITGYNKKDSSKGFSGILGKPIDAFYVYFK